ncbi:hypothetical protein BsWGS_04878 [Bradybaena similaris]
MGFDDSLKAAKERAYSLLKDQNGWKVSSKSTEHWTIESKLSDKLNCSIYRTVMWVKAPLNVVKDTLNFLPGGRRKEWDPDFKELILLKQLADNTILYVTRTNPVAKGVISPREFINVATWEETTDFYQLTGCGVEYPDFKSDDNFVRGFSGCMLMKIEKDPRKPGVVRVTTVTEMDPKGKIPRAILDSAIPGVLAGSFVTWRKFLEKEGHLKQ